MARTREDWRKARGTRARPAHPDDPSPTVISASSGFSAIAVDVPAKHSPTSTRRRRGIPEDRPPYRIPTMAEIAKIPKNGLTVATTFAGAGGSSTGYEMAGYRVLWASEFEPHAASTYAANHPSTVLCTKDIREVDPAEVLEACGGKPPDLFDGSPPCQDFSMAGKRSKGWGESRKHADGTEQRSDDLFGEYTRLVRVLQPRAFVAENVAGLVAGVAKGQFKRIMAALTDCGYTVRCRVLDAQWLGVPQRRRRVIIIGLRQDLGLEPPYPKPFPYRYSILDACPWFSELGRDVGFTDGSGFNDKAFPLEDPSMTITAFSGSKSRWTLRGGDVQVGSDWYGGSSGDDPAPPILASGSGTSEVRVGTSSGRSERKMTIAEVKRICSFPDDYVMGGTYAQQWARMGNSVPPLMMYAVASTLAPVLLGL